MDQLKGGCVAPPTFPVAPLYFEYLAMPQVYTFFRWRLYNHLSDYKWMQDVLTLWTHYGPIGGAACCSPDILELPLQSDSGPIVPSIVMVSLS